MAGRQIAVTPSAVGLQVDALAFDPSLQLLAVGSSRLTGKIWSGALAVHPTHEALLSSTGSISSTARTVFLSPPTVPTSPTASHLLSVMETAEASAVTAASTAASLTSSSGGVWGRNVLPPTTTAVDTSKFATGFANTETGVTSLKWIPALSNAPKPSTGAWSSSSSSSSSYLACLPSLLVGNDAGDIQLWNLQPPSPLSSSSSSSPSSSFSYSNDDTNCMRLQRNSVYHGHQDTVSGIDVASSFDGRFLSASWDCSVRLWDLVYESPLKMKSSDTGNATAIFEHQGEPVNCVAWQYGNQSSIFASGTQAGVLRLWDLRQPSTSPAAAIAAGGSNGDGAINAIAWGQSEGCKLAVGKENGAICIFDTRFTNGSCNASAAISSLVSHDDYPVGCLAFAPGSDSLFASGGDDAGVCIRDLSSNVLIYRSSPDTHQHFVRGISWASPSILFSGGWDSRIVMHAFQRN